MPGRYREIRLREAGAVWRGLVRSDAPEAVELCRKLDAPDTRIIKDRPSATAGCREEFFLKRGNLPGFWKQLRRRFRTPRPFRALKAAEALASLEIPTPEVVAALTETGGKNKRDDFWVHLHGILTTEGVRCAFVDTWGGCYGTIPDTPASEQDEIAFARRPEVLMAGPSTGFRKSSKQPQQKGTK